MLIDALDRTILLMRGELRPDCDRERCLEALIGVTVAIVASAKAAATASGQSAVVTAATLCARSGHDVWVEAPDMPLVGPQPPLTGDALVSGLVELGGGLLPGRRIQSGRPPAGADLVVLVGAEESRPTEDDVFVALKAGAWWASLGQEPGPWEAQEMSFGAMAAGALAAGEAFKIAMLRLAAHARAPAAFAEQFALAKTCRIDLAPHDMQTGFALPAADVISAGAIGNALFFSLLRVPGLRSEGVRVFDDDGSSLSNLNRNALLRASALGLRKVDDIAAQAKSLGVVGVPERFVQGVSLADHVLIGADDIPSRWAAQKSEPRWLGVGATAGFCVQISGHSHGQPCAGCLHSHDDPLVGEIPTVAFVSFWAGLLLATRWLRELAGRPDPSQQTFFSPLRPEGWSYASLGVSAHAACAVGCEPSRRLS